MPPNTVSVTRPGKWGNPFVGPFAAQKFRAALFDLRMCEDEAQRIKIRWMRDNIKTLQGKNLACFCKIDVECHGDSLLEIANA